jgi:2-polyprenyl-6-methoxyphenol hydroxylase-like FAD-dependent oxidoreductase
VRASPERFDVAVVGGGSAGIAAAISAAECGAHTVLVERAEALGGNVSQALVHTICGLYLPAEAGDALPANPGFPRRFATRLERADAAGEPERAGRVWVLPTDPPKLAAEALRLCRETAGLDVRLGRETIAAALTAAGGEPQRLRLREPSGREAELSATVVVDATGDGAVAALGGADTEMAEPDVLQLPSYIFRLSGVDTAKLQELQGFGRLRVTHAVAGAVRSGALPAGCEAVLVRPGREAGRIYVTLNLPRPDSRGLRPLDPDRVAELGASARAAAERVVEFLRGARPEFEKCRVEAWPARIGVRETRRICGRDSIASDDVRSGRSRPDEVAVSSWPIELWQDHRRAHFDHPTGPCSIPLDALVSRSHPRLAAAGRCLSADHEALGALRVIGAALASGEAAGVAAARAADSGSSLAEVAPEQVRDDILERAGSQTGETPR